MNKYNMYDEIVKINMLDIYSMSKEKGKIEVKEFDFKNKNHLYFLKIAEMVSTIWHYPIFLHTNRLSLFFYNLKNHKNSKIYYWSERAGIDIDDYFNVLRVKNPTLEANIWQSIYNTYYFKVKKKGKNK